MQAESVSLWNNQPGHDKVYFAQLNEVPGQGWTVTCQYGPRNGRMTDADKEPAPVDYNRAKKSYDKVVKDKIAKQYMITAGGAPSVAPVPPGTTPPVQRKLKAVVATAGMQPQLLNEVDEDDVEFYLTSPLYVAQEKFNGDRVMLTRDLGGNIGAVSARSGKERMLPESVASALEAADLVLLVDGEQVGEVFHLFDVLESGISNHRSRSVTERLAVLAELHKLLPAAHFPPTYTAHTEAEKRALLADLRARGAEGLCFKLASASYQPGRPNSGGDWIKHKFWASATVEVEVVNAKRSVGMCVYDAKGVKHSIGNVTVKPRQDIPAVGDLIEVSYLYAHKGGSLVQPELLGPRIDMTKKDASLKQLKYKATGHLSGATDAMAA